MLNGNVEPWATLDEDELAVADKDGWFITSKDVLPESGVQVPDMLTETDCELAVLLALMVVHETVVLLRLLVWLSDTLHTAQLLKSRYAELQSPLHPEAVTVNVFNVIMLPESAPDWVTLTVTAADAIEGNKATNTNKTGNNFFIVFVICNHSLYQ